MISKTNEECLVRLEKVRWAGKPCCPYCGSTKATLYRAERRYRCNGCFTSYSVTVGTLFHKTHVDLSIWFELISIMLHSSKIISIRELSKQFGINKNTITYMMTRIQKTMNEDPSFLRRLIED